MVHYLDDRGIEVVRVLFFEAVGWENEWSNLETALAPLYTYILKEG